MKFDLKGALIKWVIYQVMVGVLVLFDIIENGLDNWIVGTISSIGFDDKDENDFGNF